MNAKEHANVSYVGDGLQDSRVAGAPRLVDKQHRMVCYFFEKMFDLMIGPDNNLSSNAGFESFTGDWNRAQVN